MTEPIRVLQVVASLDRGGAEAVVMDWLRRMDPDKVAFDFVVNEGGPYAFEQEALKLGCRVLRAPVFRGWNALAYAWWWQQSLARHPEWRIVHAHHTMPASIYLSVARRMGRITIAHSHTAGRDASLAGKLRTMFRWPLRSVAHLHLACSELAGRWMFGGNTSVKVIHNGVGTARFAFDPSARRRIRDELNLQDRLVIGHVGRFTLEKNHARLLRIFVALTNLRPDARLLLVGDGGLRGRILEDVRTLSIEDKVLFTGVRQDVPALLSAMDVLLFPSHFEGLPVTVVEAQVTGLPCVVSTAVTQEVAMTDLVRFVPLGQSDDVWAAEICESFNYSARHSRIDELRAAGYDASQVASQVQGLYLQLSGEG